MIPVRPATAADAPALRGVLRHAFDADPVVNWVVRQDGGREWAMAWLFRLTLDIGLANGHAYTAGERQGVALWAPPGRPAAGQLRHAWRLPGFVRAVGMRRLPRVVAAISALSARHPRPPHWYLSELAVDPPAQGRGVGSALIAHRLAVCDQDGVAAYLENSNPRNTPLYERHGFRVVGEMRMGGDGPPLWLMWRDARPPFRTPAGP
ncbi:MAG TPA: GNAT family N-acetyltransferase [Candidatus Dormibacteraeota bacterium]|nr:GNAT family N-acetyltransferase [Candidatus Dormibacteraeota bacterium]